MIRFDRGYSDVGEHIEHIDLICDECGDNVDDLYTCFDHPQQYCSKCIDKLLGVNKVNIDDWSE